MKIGIIGGGVVGHATARTYLEHADEVRVYDVIPERSTVGDDLASVLELCDLTFICLPEGRVDPFLSSLPPTALEDLRDKNLVLRSTVPVGTTRRLASKYNLTNLVHSPEFLTARCAVTDAQVPARNIIGGYYQTGFGEFGTVELAGKCGDLLKSLYTRRFPGVPLRIMSSDESEAVKLICNGFFAAKVAYFNEVNSFCTRLGLNWDAVLRGVLSDGRVGGSHTKVPGPDGGYGFAGACLPKDLLQLIHCIEDAGVGAPVCRAVHERNKMDRERK